MSSLLSVSLQAFSGNSNTESVVRHDLAKGIMGRFLRFVPLDWSGEGRIGLRIEVYGCSYCEYTHTHTHTHKGDSLGLNHVRLYATRPWYPSELKPT